jgi:hypothetical protein
VSPFPPTLLVSSCSSRTPIPNGSMVSENQYATRNKSNDETGQIIRLTGGASNA